MSQTPTREYLDKTSGEINNDTIEVRYWRETPLPKVTEGCKVITKASSTILTPNTDTYHSAPLNSAFLQSTRPFKESSSLPVGLLRGNCAVNCCGVSGWRGSRPGRHWTVQRRVHFGRQAVQLPPTQHLPLHSMPIVSLGQESLATSRCSNYLES